MSPRRHLLLAAMVFAVAMTTIDQTIVAIAAPDIQRSVGLSASATQWVVNGYLLALASLFALGGRVADIIGRRRAVTIGVVGFAVTSAGCGLAPDAGVGAAWLIAFRVLQGAAGALMFPAAVGIVVATFEVHERGRAMAIFFGISGGLTAIGPISGGYLTQWTWRGVFWVNVPIALVALVLLHRARVEDDPRPARLDLRGAGLLAVGMGLVVLALQESGTWGWGSAATIGWLLVGTAAVIAFVGWELRTRVPLLRLEIFGDREFAADTAVLAIVSMAFVPFFFFASVYAQAALHKSATDAGLYMMWFFLGFVVCSMVGGRLLDRVGVRRPVVLGTALSTVGFALLAARLDNLALHRQVAEIAMAGGGIGMILTPASTDAVNRATDAAYSEVTGITQTARNVGASLGFAVLGTLFAHATTRHLAAAGPDIHRVQLAYAHSTQTVFRAMAVAMGVAFVVAVRWLPRGAPAGTTVRGSASGIAAAAPINEGS